MIIRRFTKREKRIAVLCLGLVFIYGGYNIVIRPLRKEMILLDQKIETQQRRLNKDLRILKKAEFLGVQYDALVKRFKQTKTNEQVMSSFVSEIEEAAAKLGLQISNLKPQKVKRSEFINRFSVSLTIDSEFVDIMNFLYMLQGQPYSFDVQEARFDKSSRRKSTAIKTRLVLIKILIP